MYSNPFFYKHAVPTGLKMLLNSASLIAFSACAVYPYGTKDVVEPRFYKHTDC